MMRLIILTVGCVVLHDPIRIGLTLFGLRRLRRDHPELFDGALALAQIETCIAEYKLCSLHREIQALS